MKDFYDRARGVGKEKLRHEVHMAIYRFLNDCGISKSVVEKKPFRDMVDTISSMGTRLASSELLMGVARYKKMQMESVKGMLASITSFVQRTRQFYYHKTGRHQGFASLCHDVADGRKREILGLSIILGDPMIPCTSQQKLPGLNSKRSGVENTMSGCHSCRACEISEARDLEEKGRVVRAMMSKRHTAHRGTTYLEYSCDGRHLSNEGDMTRCGLRFKIDGKNPFARPYAHLEWCFDDACTDKVTGVASRLRYCGEAQKTLLHFGFTMRESRKKRAA